VNGIVDDDLRALIRVPISASSGGTRTEILVWIDTAFNGGMAIPRTQIAELGLSERSSAEAVLADGNTVELPTFACYLDWFGKSYKTQIVASDGKYQLLGTILLDGHRLNVDYENKTVELT
jgi:clan AA aspartic protease